MYQVTGLISKHSPSWCSSPASVHGRCSPVAGAAMRSAQARYGPSMCGSGCCARSRACTVRNVPKSSSVAGSAEHGDDVDVAATWLPVVERERADDVQTLDQAWQPDRSDIDIVAVMAEPATDEDFGSLRTVHALLAERQPTPHIDGPYLAWADLIIAPATGLHRPWTLAGELYHDGECFEINPVTWYTLARYGVTVRGPAPETLNIWRETEIASGS